MMNDRLHIPYSLGEQDEVLVRRYNPSDWGDGQTGIDILDDVGDTVCVVLADALQDAPFIVNACNSYHALYAACKAAEQLDAYDAGLLGGDPTWSVEDWHDAIRNYLASAHDFYVSQLGCCRAALDLADGETT